MCGEKAIDDQIDKLNEGSPPHVRGKACLLSPKPPGLRITPACAGKSGVGHLAFEPEQDHPRMCGEKPALPPGVLAPPGSPPHVRGKVPQHV